MATFTLTEIEKVKDIDNPPEKGGPATVYRLTFEEDPRRPEFYATAKTPVPKPGDKVEGEIEESNFGPKFKRAGARGSSGGGFKRSPAENRKIVRQHSQEMALRREANLIASGNPALKGEQLRALIDWYENDANGKFSKGVEIDGTTSDVPADQSDLFDPGR